MKYIDFQFTWPYDTFDSIFFIEYLGSFVRFFLEKKIYQDFIL